MEINKEEVGNRINLIREKNGWSMTEFGEKIDDTARSGTVNNWVRGKNLPNNKRLKRIAYLGEMSVEELLYGSKAEQITNTLLNEFGDNANLKIIRDIIDFHEIAGDEFSLSKDNLVNTYDAFKRREDDPGSQSTDYDFFFPKHARRSFNSSELIQFLNEEILELENEITIIEHELNNNKNIEEGEFLELRSILNNLGLYSIHLEKIIEQIKIPSQDFYIYEGVFYFANESTDLTFESIKFDVSKYDTLVVFDIYNQVVTRLSDLNAKKILDVIRKYPITYEDVYKFEITKLPTKWFVTDYEVIKEPEEIQIISNKVINISGI